MALGPLGVEGVSFFRIWWILLEILPIVRYISKIRMKTNKIILLLVQLVQLVSA